MLEHVPDLTLAFLNEATQAWVEHEYNRSVHSEIAATPLARRLTPLEDRLARLLATIRIDVQREGLLLAAFQTSLRGRRRGNCHPGELGAALRRLGFERRRN